MIDIKAIRLKNNLTQQQFAKLLGISQGHISDIEQGRRKITDNLIVKLKQYAHDQNINFEEASVQEPYIQYNLPKKTDCDMEFIHKSDRTYRVNDYNATNDYKINTLLTLKKIDNIILGREYVFWLKGDPVAYIGKFGPAAGDNYTLMVPGLTEQEIPKDSVDAAYIITGEIRSNI